MNSIEKIKTEKNLNNRVYEVIRNYVIRPDTPPGIRLYEEKLAKEIGVSRTPVKIALNRLEQEGLVIINPNRGTFKVHLSWQEVTEIIKIREVLESLSLEMSRDFNKDTALQNLNELIPDINSLKNQDGVFKYPEMDQKFHEELIKIGTSQFFFKMIKNLYVLYHMLGMIILQDIERIRLSIEQHKKIIEALKINDIPLAINCLRENYESALRDLEEKKKIVPGLFR